jgi:hypothetical protein
MIIYHRTGNAEAILRDRFRDEEGSYMLEDFTLRGVFLSDKPLDANEGAGGNHLLEVTLPDDCYDFSYYELVEEGKPYREWCIPAEIINRHGTVRFATPDEENVSNIRIT